ncbi:MAG: hypothetical protein R3B67_03895 [Phycisphaerales bacterium]
MPDPLDMFGEDHDTPSGGELDDATPTYGQTPAPLQSQTHQYPVARAQIRRDVFWQNVCREILLGLAAAAAESSGRTGIGPSDAQMSPDPVSELFDGRMAIITSQGQRIPIADVFPVFAFSVPGDVETRIRSSDVQCTVFRISTPTGESYTLPISQIVGIHSLSQSLIEQMEQAEASIDKDSIENRVPFGFAAYTSLARSEQQAKGQEYEGEEIPSPDAPSGTPQGK